MGGRGGGRRGGGGEGRGNGGGVIKGGGKPTTKRIERGREKNCEWLYRNMNGTLGLSASKVNLFIHINAVASV